MVSGTGYRVYIGKTTKHGKCRFRTQVVTRSMRQQSVHITYQPTRRAAAKLCSRKEFNSSRLFPFRDIVRLRSTTQTAVSAPIGIVRARPVIPLEYLSSSRLADLHITPWRSSNETHTGRERSASLHLHWLDTRCPFPAGASSPAASFSTSGLDYSSTRRIWRGACQASFR